MVLVLVVEDELNLAQTIELYLKNENHKAGKVLLRVAKRSKNSHAETKREGTI